MFSGKTNDGYYDLGLKTAQLIREAVINSHGAAPTTSGSSVGSASTSIPAHTGTSEWSTPSTGNSTSTPTDRETSAWDIPSSAAANASTTPSSSNILADTETSPWAKASPSTPADQATSEWGKEWQ